MHHSHKSWPANLVYLPDFFVVEERRCTTSLVPHTDQLPAIQRALRRQFDDGLSRKIRNNAALRAVAAAYFCFFIRTFCCSKIWPYVVIRPPHYHPEIAVIQRVTDYQLRGGIHSFRIFYHEDFLPDVHLNGKQVRICTHVFDRFAERAVDEDRDDALALNALWQPPKFLFPAGRGYAITVDTQPTIFVPYRLTAQGYLLVTCLTPETYTPLPFSVSPTPFDFHFGPAYVPPTHRDLLPNVTVDETTITYRTVTTPLSSPDSDYRRCYQNYTWGNFADLVPWLAGEHDVTEESTVGLLNNIDGPAWAVFCKAGRQDPIVFNV